MHVLKEELKENIEKLIKRVRKRTRRYFHSYRFSPFKSIINGTTIQTGRYPNDIMNELSQSVTRHLK